MRAADDNPILAVHRPTGKIMFGGDSLEWMLVVYR